jgi:hypothetical protein
MHCTLVEVDMAGWFEIVDVARTLRTPDGPGESTSKEIANNLEELIISFQQMSLCPQIFVTKEGPYGSWPAGYSRENDSSYTCFRAGDTFFIQGRWLLLGFSSYIQIEGGLHSGKYQKFSNKIGA